MGRCLRCFPSKVYKYICEIVPTQLFDNNDARVAPTGPQGQVRSPRTRSDEPSRPQPSPFPHGRPQKASNRRAHATRPSPHKEGWAHRRLSTLQAGRRPHLMTHHASQLVGLGAWLGVMVMVRVGVGVGVKVRVGVGGRVGVRVGVGVRVRVTPHSTPSQPPSATPSAPPLRRLSTASAPSAGGGGRVQRRRHSGARGGRACLPARRRRGRSAQRDASDPGARARGERQMHRRLRRRCHAGPAARHRHGRWRRRRRREGRQHGGRGGAAAPAFSGDADRELPPLSSAG